VFYSFFLNKEPEAGTRYKLHRERVIAIMAARYPAFAAVSKSERASLAAHGLLLQLDQFCALLGQRHITEVGTAIDLMTDIVGEFLFRGAPPAIAPSVFFPTL
jgi:hypothetical protein